MEKSKAPKSLEPYLDHMVLLVPHPVLVDLPSWLTDNFTILTGGRHASGATENKLIIFPDGSYIEIIAFLSDDPPSISSSSWAKRKPGQFIDWACSGNSTDGFPALHERVTEAGTGLVYADLKAGGRTKPDGTVLKWHVSDVRLDKERELTFQFTGGEAPFWCFDETPRQLRVPANDKANTTHPSGVMGVAEVAVFVKDPALFASLEVLYSAILAPVAAGDTREAKNGRKRSFPLAAPNSAALGDREGEITVHLVEGDSEIAPEAFEDGGIHVKISLWSTKGAGKIAGKVGGKADVVFDLVDLDS